MISLLTPLYLSWYLCTKTSFHEAILGYVASVSRTYETRYQVSGVRVRFPP